MNKWFAQFLQDYTPQEDESQMTANFSVKFTDGKKIYVNHDEKTEHPVWTKDQCLEKHRAARRLDPYLEHALERIEKYVEAAKEKGGMYERMAKDNAAIFKKSAEWILQNENAPEIEWESLSTDELCDIMAKTKDQGLAAAAAYESDRRESEEKLRQEEQAQQLDQVFDATPPATPEPAKKSLFGTPKKKGLFSK